MCDSVVYTLHLSPLSLPTHKTKLWGRHFLSHHDFPIFCSVVVESWAKSPLDTRLGPWLGFHSWQGRQTKMSLSGDTSKHFTPTSGILSPSLASLAASWVGAIACPPLDPRWATHPLLAWLHMAAVPATAAAAPYRHHHHHAQGLRSTVYIRHNPSDASWILWNTLDFYVGKENNVKRQI